MDFFIVLLILYIVFLGAFLIISLPHYIKLTSIRNQQLAINNSINEYLSKNNFIISKKLILDDFVTYKKTIDCKKFIAIDTTNKKLCLIDYNKGNLIIVNFEEILNYEVYENGSQAITGGTVGGLGLGFFGANTNTICKELKLIIRLKKYETSQVTYEIISNTLFDLGINHSTEAYKKIIPSLQEVISFIEVIKNENNQHQ